MTETTAKRRKILGLCVGCGGKIEPERRGKQKCVVCAKKQGEYQRASNERRAGKQALFSSFLHKILLSLLLIGV